MHSSVSTLTIRPVDETDIGAIVRIDEKITGHYRPEVWERRVSYYVRRDPECSLVAEEGGRVIGFMLGEVRSGEFGLEEPTGWIGVLGVDPEARGKAAGRQLAEAMFEHFRARGVGSVRTMVEDDRPELLQFFAALGFAPATLKPLLKRL